MEYYQRIRNIFLKILKAFQNIVVIFKINSIDFIGVFFICRDSRICNRGLSVSCAIIMVFSTRFFRNLDLGIEWVLRCKAMELESLRFIYHHHHHVVLVARISLTLSLHFSLSFIASGRSSGQHPVSSHSC